MIFRNALLRELAAMAVATFFVLLGIVITTVLVRLLGQAASGAITTTGVAALMGFAVINYLPVLFSLTLFISVLLALTRSYRDSEMVVWFSCGVSLAAWIRPVATFAVPVILVIALLSMVLSPWAVTNSEELRRRMDSRDDVAAVSPGMFRESRQAQRVYFVEDVSGTANLVANVFVSSVQHGKQGVMVAARGFQETAENGDRFLVLLDGRRYEGEPGSADYKIYEFQRYAMRVDAGDGNVPRAPTTKSLATLALLREPTPVNLAEFSWRVGLPVSALILTLLAIPLSFVNPRAGRSMNLVLALLIYMIYSNLLSVTQAGIAQSRVSLTAGVLGVHAGMLLILILLFYQRLMLYSLFRWTR
jgi:lipopolysaccharide export system permease protein